MILATGAVHVHLLRQQLRTFTSLNVRSGECLDVHHFAVLVGVGATTINAYRRGSCPSPTAMGAGCSASSTSTNAWKGIRYGRRRRACSR